MKEVALLKAAKSYNNTDRMSNFFLDLRLVDDNILLHSLNKISNDIEKQPQALMFWVWKSVKANGEGVEKSRKKRGQNRGR